MAESKKRAADSSDIALAKKPKFEKKSGPKKNFEQQKGNKSNPFHKPGTYTKHVFGEIYFRFLVSY